MSSIHYKFRATLEFKTLQFDGLHISANDLKREICAKENIKAEAFDLVLTNSHTKRIYAAEDLIPRNSSIIVQRIPREDAKKLPKIQGVNTGIVTGRETTADSASSAFGHINQDEFKLMTEDERLAHVKNVSTTKYDPANFQKRPAIMSGPPPPTYTCNRCCQPGHWYKNCPMASAKRTTGIPSQELMETTADDPHAMVHPSGKYVKPIMHHEARMRKKIADEAPIVERVPPPELLCPICTSLLKDAVLTTCCSNSFCSECISQCLLESEDHACPGEGCGRTQVSVDMIVPNKPLRQSVKTWSSAGAAGETHDRVRIALQPSASGNVAGYSSPFALQTDSASASPTDVAFSSASHSPAATAPGTNILPTVHILPTKQQTKPEIPAVASASSTAPVISLPGAMPIGGATATTVAQPIIPANVVVPMSFSQPPPMIPVGGVMMPTSQQPLMPPGVTAMAPGVSTIPPGVSTMPPGVAPTMQLLPPGVTSYPPQQPVVPGMMPHNMAPAFNNYNRAPRPGPPGVDYVGSANFMDTWDAFLHRNTTRDRHDHRRERRWSRSRDRRSRSSSYDDDGRRRRDRHDKNRAPPARDERDRREREYRSKKYASGRDAETTRSGREDREQRRKDDREVREERGERAERESHRKRKEERSSKRAAAADGSDGGEEKRRVRRENSVEHKTKRDAGREDDEAAIDGALKEMEEYEKMKADVASGGEVLELDDADLDDRIHEPGQKDTDNASDEAENEDVVPSKETSVAVEETKELRASTDVAAESDVNVEKEKKHKKRKKEKKSKHKKKDRDGESDDEEEHEKKEKKHKKRKKEKKEKKEKHKDKERKHRSKKHRHSTADSGDSDSEIESKRPRIAEEEENLKHKDEDRRSKHRSSRSESGERHSKHRDDGKRSEEKDYEPVEKERAEKRKDEEKRSKHRSSRSESSERHSKHREDGKVADEKRNDVDSKKTSKEHKRESTPPQKKVTSARNASYRKLASRDNYSTDEEDRKVAKEDPKIRQLFSPPALTKKKITLNL